MKKKKKMNPAQLEAVRTKDFFDCILPGSVRFMSDYYIVGDSYRSVWAVREYPPSTEEQAILSQLADRSGVTLRIYHRLVEPTDRQDAVEEIFCTHSFKLGRVHFLVLLGHNTHLPPAGGTYGTEENPAKCHQEEQAHVRG